MFVKDFMSTGLITVTKETSVLKAQDLLAVNDINRLPVIEDGKLVGIVTGTLIDAKTASDATSLSKHELNYILEKLTVAEIMEIDVQTITTDNLVEEAAGKMRSKDVGSLVVVESDDPTHAVGILTDKDIFRIFVDVSGYNAPGSTVVVEINQDRKGIIKEIGELLYDLDINLSHMIVYHLKPGIRLVLHIDVKNPDNFVNALTEAGYTVSYIK